MIAPHYDQLPRVDMAVVSIMLQHNSEGEEEPFRCMRCGKLLCGIIGNATLIFEGKVLKITASIDIPCVRCKRMYRIIY